MSKESEMERLRKEAMAALRCEESRGGRSAVWGEGNLDAQIALVGEAPGEIEEREGRPFVGPSGSLLTRILEDVGIERSDLWLTNVVKCRPAAESGGRTVNRSPRAPETRLNLPWLERELEIVSPAVIVCLGAVAAKALLGKEFRLSEQRGQVFQVNGKSYIATYHPAYLLRVMSLDRQAYSELERAVHHDLRLALQTAGEAALSPPEQAFDNQLPLL